MEQTKFINIAFIGDIFPGELSYTQNYGIRTQFNNHRGIPWIAKIKSIIGENDIVIGNLESPLVSENESIKKTFFGNPKFVEFLKESGINILNVSNNHILEQGKNGFQSTISELSNSDINIIGESIDFESKILLKEVNGLKLALAGFSNIDLNFIKNDDDFATLTEENVLNVLEKMKKLKADLKILCFHWGNEYIHVPSLDQRKMAYKFIENGADIIAGHHSHVIQPYEKYKNGHIFYSLGNFLFDYIHSKKVSIGLVARLEAARSKKIKVILNGVKLSFKNTIEPIPKSSFDKHYNTIDKLYKQFSNLTEDEYENRYNKLLKSNRLQQRILMKTSIFNELIRINIKDKKLLITNIFNYYFGK
jgi:poly-gamma-glutamate synthesis protein (capsule biosynthesis protein)